MAYQKKHLFTGLQPSGQLHIGNYFGALLPIADLCSDTVYKHYESITLMVADYHALTTLKDPRELKENIVDVVKAYLAVLGERSKRVLIFKQSDVPEHTELTWIFNCLVTESFLKLGHAYKDKRARGIEANFGLIDYPVLMAADILLYSNPSATTWIPVGEDQEQHLEYAREIAGKFNAYFPNNQKIFSSNISAHRWGDVGKVPGTDGQKMSKSYKNTIPLFGTKDEIAKAVMSITTNSEGERPEIVFTIHKLFKTENELEPLYKANKGNYKTLKEALISDIEATIGPMRQRYNSISDNEVKEVLREGAKKAERIAAAKMKMVRKVIGVAL